MDQVLADADKAQDYLTVSNRMISDEYVQQYFPKVYKRFAHKHGYQVKEASNRYLETYQYLVDGDGNIKMYDAEVAKDALQHVNEYDLLEHYKPLNDKDIANSKAVLDDVIFVGENKDVLTFEYTNNPVYGRYGESRVGNESRIMTGDQKQAYIDAINTIDISHLPHLTDSIIHDDEPLTIHGIAETIDFVNNKNGDVYSAWINPDADINKIKDKIITSVQSDNALLDRDFEPADDVIYRVVNHLYEPMTDEQIAQKERAQQEAQAVDNPIIQGLIEPLPGVAVHSNQKGDSELAPVFKDADKINDYYTAQKVMAEDVDEDTFAEAYKDAARDHGFEPKVFEDTRGYEDDFVYLMDDNGNVKTYDADVAKDTFKSLAASGEFDADDYEPLDKRAISQSQNMAGQFHLVGRNHDVPVLDFVENELYDCPTSDDYKSRYLTDADKELYINAVKNAPDVDNEALDDSPLSLSSIVQNFDPVYDDAVGNGNGEYFDTIASEHGLEEDDATFVYKATPEQDNALREDLIDRIKNDEFVRTAKIDYFYPEVEDKARSLDAQQPVADADNLDGFLAGLDDLNKNQDKGLQQ